MGAIKAASAYAKSNTAYAVMEGHSEFQHHSEFPQFKTNLHLSPSR